MKEPIRDRLRAAAVRIKDAFGTPSRTQTPPPSPRRTRDDAEDAPPPSSQSSSADMEVFLQQLSTILEKEHNVILPPPKHLQTRVVGGYFTDFMQSGYRVFDDLSHVVAAAGMRLSDFSRILDFGCGCGRATRALKNLCPTASFHGIDIDGEAVGWLREHYSSFGDFSVAPHAPPTSFPDDEFDFVFGISVLTHLPEDLQFQWLAELRRIAKPGGYLVLTVHGERYYRDSSEVNAIMKERGFFYSGFGRNYGASINLPDFYQTAFHSHEYIRREWSKWFQVVDIQPERMNGQQDTVLLRRSPHSQSA